MKCIPSLALLAAVVATITVAAMGGSAISAQDRFSVQVPEGVALSEFRGYEKWQMVGVSQSGPLIEVILGNPAMVQAYELGLPAEGKKFPDGAKMVKIHWNARKSPE